MTPNTLLFADDKPALFLKERVEVERGWTKLGRAAAQGILKSRYMALANQLNYLCTSQVPSNL